MPTNDPFSSQSENPYSFTETPRAELPLEMQRGLVNHVPVLGVLTIVQGSMVALVGIFLVAMAVLVPAMMGAGGVFPVGPGMPQRPAPPMPAPAEWIMAGVYGAMGLTAIGLGVLNIVGGIRILQFRGRILGIVAWSCGLLSLFSCYCFPTSIALFIYGVIVMNNAPVKRAFDMAAAGESSADIRAHYSQLPMR